MGVEVRRCENVEEFADALNAIGQYFGGPLSDERIERWLKTLELERMHGAWSDGSVVGGAGAFSFELSVPGGRVPTAGLTVVGVYPTHRRRGVLTAMMRAQLDDARERGDVISALWASEAQIYGRYGYGMASLSGGISIARDRAAFAVPLESRASVRLVSADQALEAFPPIWERVFDQRPGMFTRTREWWESRALFDAPDQRDGVGPKRFALLELDGDARAYAIYQHRPKWEDFVSASALDVREAIGVDAGATAALWRYLFDIDWQATIEGRLLPVDHPLFFLVEEPRRLGYSVADALWVRLIDVGPALSARSYATGGRVVFEVRDRFCDWNEGRWELSDGEAHATDAEPDIACDVNALGSVYLGGFTFRQLYDAGRIDERVDGAVARADAIFRTDRAPWCPEIF